MKTITNEYFFYPVLLTNHIQISSQQVLQALSQAFQSLNSSVRYNGKKTAAAAGAGAGAGSMLAEMHHPLNRLHLYLKGNIHRIDVETLSCNDHQTVVVGLQLPPHLIQSIALCFTDRNICHIYTCSSSSSGYLKVP